MSIDDLLVVLICWLGCVARPKETWTLPHVVVGPLLLGPGEGCVSKVILVVWTAGGAALQTKEGSATLQNKKQKREFDPTRGFPGEDIRSYRKDISTLPLP